MDTSEVIPKRGRGRPRKVVEEVPKGEEVVEGGKAIEGTRKASTKSAKEGKEKAVKAPAKSVKKTSTGKSATAKTATTKAATAKKTEAKITRSKKTEEKVEGVKRVKAEKVAPVSPSTSKILQEVAAKGTLKNAVQAAASRPAESTPSPVVSEAVPAQGSTTTATQTQELEPTISTSTPPEAQQTEAVPAAAKPTSPSPAAPAAAPVTAPSSRATTIPLPTRPQNPTASKPLPKQTPLARIIPRAAHSPITRPPPSTPKPKPEPVLDGQLPSKYKPASRRITSIIVGIPVIVVVGYVLWGRWQKDPITHKYGFRDPPPLRKQSSQSSGADSESGSV